MVVNYKKLNSRAIAPTRGSACAAGLDLYALIQNGAKSQRIPAGATVKIGTGIAMEIPDGYFGAVFARSGLATKMGLRPANCVGVVDSDYRGEIIVALHNDTDNCQTIRDGDRVAQLVIMPYLPVELCEMTDLSDTARGAGGFGSTGVSANEAAGAFLSSAAILAGA